MNKINLIFIFLLLVFGRVYSHEDRYEIKDFGNIKIRIKTGYKYEEVNKVILIGKFAQGLSKRLNYTNQIFLDFQHFYVGYCEKSAYFISFDKGNYGVGYREGKPEKDFLKKKSIVIRQSSNHFDLQNTLQLLEYSIININKIKNEQKDVVCNENYCNWKIKSINNKEINKIINSPVSKIVFSFLNSKIYLTRNNSKISYFLQNKNFTVTYKNKKNQLEEIIKLKNIYYFCKIDFETVILFETKNSFYYIHKNRISIKHYIPSPKIEFRPYKIEKNKNFVSFYYFESIRTDNNDEPFKSVKIEHRYFIKNDELLINTAVSSRSCCTTSL